MLSPLKEDSRPGGTVEGAMQISENKGPDLAAPSSMVRGPQAHWDKAEALTLQRLADFHPMVQNL
jgi:hypothetical protein